MFIVSSAGDIEEAGIVANLKTLINLCRRLYCNSAWSRDKRKWRKEISCSPTTVEFPVMVSGCQKVSSFSSSILRIERPTLRRPHLRQWYEYYHGEVPQGGLFGERCLSRLIPCVLRGRCIIGLEEVIWGEKNPSVSLSFVSSNLVNLGYMSNIHSMLLAFYY